MPIAIHHIRKTFVRQHDQNDCGIACLLSIIRFYGGEKSLEDLRLDAGTQLTGTTFLGLYQAAEKSGFKVNAVNTDLQSLLPEHLPCILYLKSINTAHYVVYYGERDIGTNELIIGDPAQGILIVSKNQLQTLWNSGAALILQPDILFQKVYQTNREKCRILKELIWPDRIIIVITVSLSIVTSVTGLSFALFSRNLIDVVLPSRNNEQLIAGIGILTLLIILRSGIVYLHQNLMLTQGRNFNERLGKRVFPRVFHTTKSFHDARNPVDITNRFQDIFRIQKTVNYLSYTVITDILLILFSALYISSFSIHLAVLCLIFAPLSVFFVFKYTVLIWKNQLAVLRASDKTESAYLDFISGISTIKENSRERFFSEKSVSAFSGYQKLVFNSSQVVIRFMLQNEILASLAHISAIAFSAYQVMKGQMSVGELVSIFAIMATLNASLLRTAQVTVPVNEARAAFDRLYELLTAKPEFERDSKRLKPFTFQKLEVLGVSFGFAGRKPLLQHVNMQVAKGEMVALLGRTGSGKSSLFNLLQKFDHPSSGQILVNGEPLDLIDTRSWRSVVGVVPQTIKVFNGSLLANIILDETHLVAKDELSSFLYNLGFDHFFNALPAGINTMVGDKGVKLSGGQKQLLGLARALHKKPQLLLLDESTSALDPETESFIINLLQRIKVHAAILMITHDERLHVLADRKIQLD